VPALSISQNTNVRTYPVLFRRVKETLLEGQRRIEAEKVFTYWDTGRLIQAHILENRDRAEYGGEVIARLSDDLHIEISTLHRCVRFYQVYPKVGRGPQFSWSHYRWILCSR